MIDWISVREKLPECYNLRIFDEYGIYKSSKNYLIATKHGGFYIGYLEQRRTLESKRWMNTWCVASIQDDGIDCDGTEIENVIAWAELTRPKFK